MNDTLYLQLDANIEIRHPHVYLQDIARMSCTNPKLLNRLRVIPVIHLDARKPGRYVMSVMDLVELIQKKEPSLTITPIGEPAFILTYTKSSPGHALFRYIKIVAVCLISFFGAAFSIMTFLNDADLGGLLSNIYTQVTGRASNGFTILEIAFSAGLGLGVLFFFNHFGHSKLTSDPTPMQVQMRNYENDVNSTIIEDISRLSSERQPDHRTPS